MKAKLILFIVVLLLFTVGCTTQKKLTKQINSYSAPNKLLPQLENEYSVPLYTLDKIYKQRDGWLKRLVYQEYPPQDMNSKLKILYNNQFKVLFNYSSENHGKTKLTINPENSYIQTKAIPPSLLLLTLPAGFLYQFGGGTLYTLNSKFELELKIYDYNNQLLKKYTGKGQNKAGLNLYNTRKKGRLIIENAFKKALDDLKKQFMNDYKQIVALLIMSTPNPVSEDIITSMDKNFFVRKYVENKIRKWQKKSEFKKFSEYKKRVNEQSRKQKAKEFAQEALEKLGQNINFNNLKISKYDAENETFLIKSNYFQSIVLPVSINNSKNFKSNWDQIKTRNPKYDLNNNKLILSELTFVDIISNKKYKYNRRESSTYAINQIDYNFEETNYEQTERKQKAKSKIVKKNIDIGQAEIDRKIPKTNVQKNNTYALIIGNENYKKYQPSLTNEQNVEYAKNDAKIFAKYCRLTMGIPKENIRLETNVISSRMRRDIEWLVSRAQYGGKDVKLLFYYSGHGAPHEETKEKYLMPVDISGAHVDEGIKLSKLYQKLTQYPVERVTVFLDACFSGSGRETGLLAAKAVKIKPKDNTIFDGNLVSFSSSQGQQRSYFYREKKHGLFTYYVLKKIKQTKGKIKFGELKDYLTKKVPLKAIDLYEDEQLPAVNYSLDVKEKWKNWKLNDME